MASVFYCTELSFSCWYCNTSHDHLHQIVDEPMEAYLYDFGEYEDTAMPDPDQTEGNKKETSPTGLPLLFPLIRSESNLSSDKGISNNTNRKQIKKNVKLPVVFNLM